MKYGQHDDIIDTTAVAIYITFEEMPPPHRVKTAAKGGLGRLFRRGGEATI